MESQQTPNSAPTKPSERLYEKLSDQQMDRVLTEFKRTQDEDRARASVESFAELLKLDKSQVKSVRLLPQSPKGTPASASATTRGSNGTKPSERLYEKLSPAEKEAVLREVKALQDDPRTTWLKKGEAEKNAEESRAGAQALEIYDRLSARRGPVDDALNAAAEEIAAGKPADAAKQRAYEVIREVIRQTLAEGQEGRGPGSEGAAGRSENEPG